MVIAAVSPRAVELSSTLQNLEDVLLLGISAPDLDFALKEAIANDHIPDDLRRDIESLFWCRAHYTQPENPLSDAQTRQVRYNDGDWTMHLVQRIRSLAHARAPYSVDSFKKKA